MLFCHQFTLSSFLAHQVRLRIKCCYSEHAWIGILMGLYSKGTPSNISASPEFFKSFWDIFGWHHILLDPLLSREAETTSVVQSAFQQLVAQLQPYLDWDNLATLTYALETSGLNYGNALYPAAFENRLGTLINAESSCPAVDRFETNRSPILFPLHRLPLFFWAQFKVLDSSGPQYLMGCLFQYESIQILRLAFETLLLLWMRLGGWWQGRGSFPLWSCLWNALQSLGCLLPSQAFERQKSGVCIIVSVLWKFPIAVMGTMCAFLCCIWYIIFMSIFLHVNCLETFR